MVIKSKMATPGSVVKKVKKESRTLDISYANRGVWLVKVPNYVSEAWKKVEPHKELGKMRIYQLVGAYNT